MDVSLEELIKNKKIVVAKRKPVQLQQQRKRQQQQQGNRQQQPQQRQQPVGDARDRISKLRKQQLVGLDARQRIELRKRQGIKDARQMLVGKQIQQPQLVKRPASGLSTSTLVRGAAPLPKKVVSNEHYRERPVPPPQLEYEEDEPEVSYPRAPPQYQARTQQRGREIPVQVSRQRRERSRSPVRRHAPPPQLSPPPPPLPQPQTTIVQAYKVSISNLHPGVTREDIYELFSSLGPVKKCVLLREGAAEVVYPSKDHALAAVHRYDRRELDGMPMHLRLSVVGIKVHAPSTPSSSRASAGAVDERAVRAALFRGGGGSGGRPVNFQVSM